MAASTPVGTVLREYASLVPGRLIRRYKRFLADIKIGNELVTVHCPNTGPMTGLLDRAGAPVLLAVSDNDKRKYRHTLEWIKPATSLDWVGVHSAGANALCRELLERRAFPSLGEYNSIKSEVKLGDKTRIDFVLHRSDGREVLVEVKSVTLVELCGEPGAHIAPENQGDETTEDLHGTWPEGEVPVARGTASHHHHVAIFPDTTSERALKHVTELKHAVESSSKKEAVCLMCIQRGDCASFAPAWAKDPQYAAAMQAAVQSGVKVIAFSCRLAPTKKQGNRATEPGTYNVEYCGEVPVNLEHGKAAAAAAATDMGTKSRKRRPPSAPKGKSVKVKGEDGVMTKSVVRFRFEPRISCK